MNQLTKVFSYGSSHVRTVLITGEPWFVAKDVCAVLEIKNTTDALKRLDSDEVTRLNLGGLSGETNLVNEPGLYTLILGSRKPEARAFKRWITHEVIPSIRRNGMYATDTLLDDPDLLLKTVTRLTEERRARLAAEAQVIAQAPKVRAFDTFMDAEGTQTVNEVAKAIGWGRNKLFGKLREIGVLMANNKPYQRYINAGYFVVKETVKNRMPFTVTFVTPKGVAFIERTLVEESSA